VSTSKKVDEVAYGTDAILLGQTLARRALARHGRARATSAAGASSSSRKASALSMERSTRQLPASA
jgi:hypothetical protein